MEVTLGLRGSYRGCDELGLFTGFRRSAILTGGTGRQQQSRIERRGSRRREVRESKWEEEEELLGSYVLNHPLIGRPTSSRDEGYLSVVSHAPAHYH